MFHLIILKNYFSKFYKSTSKECKEENYKIPLHYIVSIQEQHIWQLVDWKLVDAIRCIAPRAKRIPTTMWSR